MGVAVPDLGVAAGAGVAGGSPGTFKAASLSSTVSRTVFLRLAVMDSMMRSREASSRDMVARRCFSN